METVISLGIDESRTVTQTTGKLSGELEAFVISSPDVMSLTITLEKFPNIVIYECRNMKGEFYIPVRIQPQNFRGDGFNYGMEEYYLQDDKLILHAQGPTGIVVKVHVRIKGD